MGLFNFFFKKKQEFNVGDVVVCVDDRGDWSITRNPPIYRELYEILDVYYDKQCNDYAYDYGARFIDPNVFSENDYNNQIPGAGIRWTKGFRFIKANEKQTEKFLKRKLDKYY